MGRQKRIAAEKAAAAEQMARKLAPPVSSAAPMRSTNRVPEKPPAVRKERNDRERDRDRDKERGRETRDRDRRDKSRDREKIAREIAIVTRSEVEKLETVTAETSLVIER